MTFHIPGPFGGCDEKAETAAFEDLCGGAHKAGQLSRLWQNSTATPWPPGHRYYRSRVDVFTGAAKREGFTDEQIEAFFHF